MRTKFIDITQQEPVLFRIEWVTSNPFPAWSPTSDVLVHIERLNPHRQHVYGMPLRSYLPYREALRVAFGSQDVFWVDLDYSKTPVPPRLDDTVLDRFLNAIANDQRVVNAPTLL